MQTISMGKKEGKRHKFPSLATKRRRKGKDKEKIDRKCCSE
jgi:hypothetical protein